MHSAENLIRILLVDDDEDDFFITSEHIKNITDGKFQIDWSYNYQQALEHMKARSYDMYLVDYYLGAKTGLDLLKEAIGIYKCEEPIVLLTGKGTQAIDKEAMQAGAMDYLIKTELNTEKLGRCIRYALERYASTKALRANEIKYRNIFERSKDAVFLASKNLQFRDINSATSDLLGYEKEELVQMTFYQLLESDDRRLYIAQQLKEIGEVNDKEVELLTKAGERKNCILNVSTETDPEGYDYLHGLLHDITQLKKAEKATLQVEKLAAAGRLVRTLAHEVRNPLNNINLSVEQLRPEVQEKEDSKIYLDIIHRNSKRIGDIITELLNTSRPSEMFMEKRPLQEIMDKSLAAAIDRITLQRVKMQVRYTDSPAYILADSEKLKIAFLNIIINAVEAMPEEKGQLNIFIETEKNNHIVKISDNGSGISEENLSRLFEPYFTSKRNGMGLGLAASLNILQAHKAHIEVASEANKGTVFTVSFSAA